MLKRTLFCISARAEAASSLGLEASCRRVGAPDARRASGMGLTLMGLLLLPPFLPLLILLLLLVFSFALLLSPCARARNRARARGNRARARGNRNAHV